MKKLITIIVMIAAFAIPSTSRAIDKAIKISDREIVESLAEIKSEVRSLNKRFDDVNNHINLLASIFAAIVIAVIGFAIWDRRTMVRPFEDKVRKIEDDIAENRTKLHTLLDALRNLSKTDSNVAEVLKRFNLL